jgi:hypothetical protein
MSITRSRRRVPRERKAACGPDNMTGRPSKASAFKPASKMARFSVGRLITVAHALAPPTGKDRAG